jgi:hypothetical protein
VSRLIRSFSSLARSPRVAAGVALCVLASFAVPLGPTEKDFEDQLGVVERTIAAGKWKEAKTLLLATLEKHKDQQWVLYHLTEIKDDLERCAFGAATPKPNPKDLISGNLVSYSPSSGQIDLRYELDKPAPEPKGKPAATGSSAQPPAKKRVFQDFATVNDFHVHPLAFEGPYKITLSSDAFARVHEGGKYPVVVVGYEWDQSYVIVLGSPARIVWMHAGEETELDTAATPQSFGAHDVEIAVAQASISVSVDGSKLLGCAKGTNVFGRFGYGNFPSVRAVRISGKAQSSWLDGVVDSSVQEQKSKFHSQYKVKDDLPDWLNEKTKTARANQSFFDSYPGAEHPKGKEHLMQVDALMKKNDVKGASEYVKAIPDDDVTPALRAWLSALIELGHNELTQSLDECRKVTALDPHFFRARQLQLRLESRLDSGTDMLEQCRALTKDFESEPDSYSELAIQLLRADRIDEARATVRAAIDRGIAQEDLEEVDHLLSRAVKGPTWTRSYEYKSEHYDVMSDISQTICFEAATLLEKFYLKYNVHLRRVASGPKRLFRVYLFSGQASYAAYTKDLLGHERKNTAGLYSGLVKQLLIWNLPDVQDMMRTVKHEGFHQYLDRVMQSPPTWLNEGMAMYFEGSKLVNGNWSDGEMQPAYLRGLEKAHPVPLKELIHLDPVHFYAEKRVDMNYATSWAFVHFLLNSGPEHKKRFDKLMDALFAGTKASDAVSQAFDDESLPVLQSEFETYVKALK